MRNMEEVRLERINFVEMKGWHRQFCLAILAFDTFLHSSAEGLAHQLVA